MVLQVIKACVKVKTFEILSKTMNMPLCTAEDLHQINF